MKYVVTVNNCGECHYASHSGAFTPGGAQPVCGHPKTVSKKGPEWTKRVIPHVMVKGGYRNMENCAKLKEKIPGWCPLRATEVT